MTVVFSAIFLIERVFHVVVGYRDMPLYRMVENGSLRIQPPFSLPLRMFLL